MKRMFSVALCCIVLIMCLYFPSSAAEEKTVLYLNYGNIKISDNQISGYNKEGQKLTEPNPSGYIITQSNPKKAIDKGITVTSAHCAIELNNLNIERFSEYNCAFTVQNTSEVTVTITGENHLVSGSSRAGFEIDIDSTATINGDGILYAQSSLQAGIGGGNGQPNGTLTINSGTIYATGGIDGYSAGIGGGSSGGGGNITINGGYICAEGGLYASGIGGGFMSGGGNITINGGVITATGGDGGAGIGSGYLCNSETNVIINGGSVKAVGGDGADNIGNGTKAKTEFSGIYNSDCNTVLLVKYPVNDFDKLYINGIDTAPIVSLHPNDSSLYLYSDDTEKIITAYMQDGSVKFFKFNNTGVSEIYPFTNGNERFRDKLIVSKDSPLSVLTEFDLENDSDLIFNSVRVDSFETVLRGDLNYDSKLDGMDAVICNCVMKSIIDDSFAIKLSDTDGNGTTDSNDVILLEQYGLGGN